MGLFCEFSRSSASPIAFQLAQGAALDFAGGGVRQFVDEFDGARIFEGGNLRFDEILHLGDQRVTGDRCVAQLYEGLDDLAAVRVRCADQGLSGDPACK